MRIFLTGATGFLGQELLKALHSRNHQVTALVRTLEKASVFPPGVQSVQGKIEDLAGYREALTGQDVFVHVAALVKMWVRDRAEFDRINVESLEKAVRASSDARVPKFIYASSFMALGPSDGPPLTEADTRRTDHFHNDYERTKHLGDRTGRKLLAEGHPLYILYPGVIYGPGNLTDGNIVAKSLIPFLNGKMPFGLALKEWSYSYIQDVVSGFIKVIEEQPASRRYILGGDNRTGTSFYQTLYEVSGKKPPAMNIPMPMAIVAGYGEYLLAELFGREPSMLTHEVARIYQHAWAYDSSLAIRELDYKITPLKEGLAKMVNWLKSEGYVKRMKDEG